MPMGRSSIRINRAFFEGLQTGQLKIPFIPQPACSGPSDVPPIWNPEFFGNTMIVNGRTWPYLDVEQRRYRFRFLNGCDSRFLILRLSRAGLPFWQIGADGGFLPAPVRLDQLLMGPAERADVIVDFTDVPAGTEIVLLNAGPDEPFCGGEPDLDFDAADRRTTGMVMQFRVRPARSIDLSIPPEALVLPPSVVLPEGGIVRQLSLSEAESRTVRVDGHPGHGHRKHQPANLKVACDDPAAVPFGPTMALLGTVAPGGEVNPLRWTDAITETPHRARLKCGRSITSRKTRTRSTFTWCNLKSSAARRGESSGRRKPGNEAPRTRSSHTLARSRG